MGKDKEIEKGGVSYESELKVFETDINKMN
jgi:hypothetical protein